MDQQTLHLLLYVTMQLFNGQCSQFNKFLAVTILQGCAQIPAPNYAIIRLSPTTQLRCFSFVG